MNKNYVNNNFHGAICGKRAVDYYRKINTKSKTYNDAIDNIKDILNIEEIDGIQFTDEFWTKVFLQNDEDDYEGGVKLILNKDDSLYSESNIAKTLEKMATNILDKATKKDNPETFTKVYHSVELFNKALNDQNELREILNNTNDGKYALNNALNDYFVLANQMNYKFEKKITKLNDLELKKLNDKYGSKFSQVNDYYQSYIKLKEKYNKLVFTSEEELSKYPKEERSKYKFRKLNYEDLKLKYMLNKHIKMLKDDFIDCINKKVRPIVFKASLPDSGTPDWDLFDETDTEHVRASLRVSKGYDMTNDLSVILGDLNDVIKECDLNDMQRDILFLLKSDDTLSDIAGKLSISPSELNRYIKLISKRIVEKNYEKIEDWYYLNICKGKYKKCKKCGEVKLIQCFSKEPKGIMGVKSKCKQCPNK